MVVFSCLGKRNLKRCLIDITMHVLVTGGAGFIGAHTTNMLIDSGFRVRVVDNLDPQIHKHLPAHLNQKAEFIRGDITHPDTWEKALKGTDAVLHLAAMTGIGQSMYEPSSYFRTNTLGTALLYETLLKRRGLRRQIKKIIVASSKTIYGEGTYLCRRDGLVYPPLRTLEQLKRMEWDVRCPLCQEPAVPTGTKEEKPPQNLSIYALTKYSTEVMSLLYGNALEIPTIAMRYFSAYGPYQSLSNPYTGVCSIFLSLLKNRKPPVIYEDGNQLRDFVYVEDIARANLLALERDATGVYNIGSGVGTRIRDIADALINVLGINIQPTITQEFRVGDTRCDFADISKAKREFGFSPQWTLRRGLEKLVEWGQQEYAEDLFEKAERERKAAFGGG